MKLNGNVFRNRVRNRRLFAGDILISALSPALALMLRLDDTERVEMLTSELVAYTALAMAWRPAVLYVSGLYQQEWRYAGVVEWSTLARGVLASYVTGILIYFAFLRPLGILPPEFPRSVVFIDGLLAATLSSAIRFWVSFVFYQNVSKKRDGVSRRVLIAGAGAAGSMTVREMLTNPQLHLEPVCFVDDDVWKSGKYIHGLEVVGTIDDIPKVIADHQIEEVIVAMPTASGKVNRRVVQMCKECEVPSRTVPGIFEILGGTARVSEFRDVQIEDLLRRGVVQDEIEGSASHVRGLRVMVTGAGGSIGSELCRQICKFKPAELLLLGHGENSVFEIASELRRQCLGEGTSGVIRSVIADIRDSDRMHDVFKSYRPEVIFHAAAHKHVGLMEENIADAVTNNIEGTQVLVDLADRFGVDRLIMISTDKAVNPTSIMGVTKRVSELIVSDAAARSGRAFVAVRFGNVLGSRGSVVPIFKQQIAAGGPVCVTHPEVKRYFMTIPEASQLVLQAAQMGEGGEVFVLDMGEPIKIVELARDLIRLSGLEEGKDIDIAFTGLLPGEKLHEDLFFANEKKEASGHEKIFLCRNGAYEKGGNGKKRAQDLVLRHNITRLIKAAHGAKVDEIQHLLNRIVPEYQPGILDTPVPLGSDEVQKPVPTRALMSSLKKEK